jgi:hypothetical protein
MRTQKMVLSLMKSLAFAALRGDGAGIRPGVAGVPFVKASCKQAMAWYDPEKMGGSRLAIGNAIRLMCRAKKSRIGDHFAASIGLRSTLEGFAPEIPDWADDQHTIAGKKLGRGLKHFREEGTKLIPEPIGDDPYEDEAYRLWQIKQQGR